LEPVGQISKLPTTGPGPGRHILGPGRSRVNLRSAYDREMKQVAKPEPLEPGEAAERERPLVFLDTNVIIGFLLGDTAAAQLFFPPRPKAESGLP